MNKEMVISSTPHETRVAILEDDQAVEIFIEREHSRGVVGNIYKGRVSKVLPGMQSAFVDLGLERDAFLYVTDVISPTEEALEDDEDLVPAPVPEAAASGEPVPDEAANGVVSQDSAPELEAVEVPEAPGTVLNEDAIPAAAEPTPPNGTSVAAATGAPRNRQMDRRRPERQAPTARIEDLVKEKQEIVVQVVKEPLGTKGARITCHLSLPGRFLVYMPTVDHIGVSRKIDSRDERKRLRTIVQRFREQSGLPGGVIIRTAAAHRSEEDLTADLTYFQQVWTEIQRRRENDRTPAVLFREESLVTKLLRDLLTEQFTAIRIDDETEHRRVMSLVNRIMPNMAARVKRYTKDYPIFDEYGVQAEIDKALRSKVWLKSGGYIVINQTEALVAIDVNTGRYVGKKTAGRLEDTIVKTNLEAVKEIIRQIRLRDLGGIIVLDFIDMEDKKNRQKVAQAVEQELRKDRAPSKAVQVSDFGLIIITRKRVKSSLERTLTEPCPYCTGTGTIKTSATICYDILTEVKKVSTDLDGYSLVIRVNPEIARALRDESRGVLKELESTVGRSVTIRSDEQMHHEQFDLMAI
ncbi:MAG TPA: Rne/Rng family ribonuclease [Vicinamibacterales bacterium]|nr:Rne/Rng family ribonuclease [Vicinamibacterales bacterium]